MIRSDQPREPGFGLLKMHLGFVDERSGEPPALTGIGKLGVQVAQDGGDHCGRVIAHLKEVPQ